MAREIFVTFSDIKNGLKGCSDECPVALALRREGFIGAIVLNESIEWNTPFGTAEISAPHSVVEFVNKFDNGLDVIPTLTLRVGHDDEAGGRCQTCGA